MGVQATVLGASGYSGGELVRLLVRHPAISVSCVSAGSRAGAPAAEVLPHVTGALDLTLAGMDEALSAPADVLFSCLPSGEFGGVPTDRLVVDLSDDHRADAAWTYGLTEFARDRVSAARAIANPGCYPTATLLCLVPFARAGVLEGPLMVDALSGTSGAGRKAQDHLLHASVHANAMAYGTVQHRHIPEMERALAAFGGSDATVSFTPHLVPMSRGLLVTARARLVRDISDAEALDVLRDAYRDEPFVAVTADWPSTKSVHGTNNAIVSARVDQRARLLVCSAAIDNLGKGAAGQAIQNANLALGLEETTGLEASGVWP